MNYALICFLLVVAILICLCGGIFSYLNYKLKRSGPTIAIDQRDLSLYELRENRKIPIENPRKFSLDLSEPTKP